MSEMFTDFGKNFKEHVSFEINFQINDYMATANYGKYGNILFS